MTRIRTTTTTCTTNTLFYRVALTILLSIAVVNVNVTVAVVNAEEQQYEFFDGTIGDTDGSSWFEPTRWTGIGVVPTIQDSVWIDESNTYVAIDDKSSTAQVSELIVGRSGSSNTFESVQLDLFKDTALTVATDMTIGQYGDSDGTVYVQDGAEITVDGLLTVGMEGNGVLILSGSAKLMAGDLQVNNNNNNNSGKSSMIIMGDASTLKIKGDKRSAINSMIGDRLIVTTTRSSKTFKVKKSNGDTLVKIVDAVVGGPGEPCEDRVLEYKGKKKKKCKWVKKKGGKRCKLVWKNELLSDWCPKSCNMC